MRAAAAEKSKNIIKVKRAWYKLIRETKSAAAWESILKIFLVLLESPQAQTQAITYRQLGEMANCSKTTVERAVKVICSIDFVDFRFHKEVIKVKTDIGNEYRTLGTVYIQGIDFE